MIVARDLASEHRQRFAQGIGDESGQHFAQVGGFHPRFVAGFDYAEGSRGLVLEEITDPLAVLKSANRAAELTRLVKAVATGRFTPATFDVLDPVPFYAEFGLWATNGLARQRKAKRVLANS